jgi:hypothetical protein
VGIRLGYSLRVRSRFPERARGLSLPLSVQTCSGAHLASYPMGTGFCFTVRVTLLGLEADQSV